MSELRPLCAYESMPLGLTALLLLFFLPLCCTHIEDKRKAKVLYFQKLTQIYDELGLNGKELAQRHVLMGLLSDATNTGSTPREERTVRDMELIELATDGSFEARLLTESLSASFKCMGIQGTVDFASFSIAVSRTTKLGLSLCVKDRIGGDPTSTRITKDTHVNNGSKGKLND